MHVYLKLSISVFPTILPCHHDGIYECQQCQEEGQCQVLGRLCLTVTDRFCIVMMEHRYVNNSKSLRITELEDHCELHKQVQQLWDNEPQILCATQRSKKKNDRIICSYPVSFISLYLQSQLASWTKTKEEKNTGRKLLAFFFQGYNTSKYLQTRYSSTHP